MKHELFLLIIIIINMLIFVEYKNGVCVSIKTYLLNILICIEKNGHLTCYDVAQLLNHIFTVKQKNIFSLLTDHTYNVKWLVFIKTVGDDIDGVGCCPAKRGKCSPTENDFYLFFY